MRDGLRSAHLQSGNLSPAATRVLYQGRVPINKAKRLLLLIGFLAVVVVAGIVISGGEWIGMVGGSISGCGMSDPYSAAMSGGILSEEAAMGMKGVLMFVKFVGLLAWFRGLWHLKRAGDNVESSDVNTKAFIHIMGGTLALNIEFAISVLADTFGVPVVKELIGLQPKC